MKFRYVDPHRIERMIPGAIGEPIVFARALDRLFEQKPAVAPAVIEDGYGLFVRRMTPGGPWGFDWRQGAGEIAGSEIIGISATEDGWALRFPLLAVMRAWRPQVDASHMLYAHHLDDGENNGPRIYVGVTSQSWHARFRQHLSAARSGSNLAFHRALRTHGDRPIRSTVHGLGSFEEVMNLEEDYVAKYTLYPKGLNMIPGGFAGIKYLAAQGFPARSAEDRDAHLARFIEQARCTDGSPNPLCAARWASDQEYVNSVICSHSGRLTVDQVRNIRMLSASGYDEDKIAETVADSPARVRRVLDNRRYQRVH